MNCFSFYFYLIKVRLQMMLEYRNAFLWGAFSQAASYFVQFLLIWVLINQFHTIGKWAPYEVMFLFSLNLISYSVAGFFFYSLYAFLPQMIRTGEFDEILTKPLNPFLYFIFGRFNYGYFSHFTLSILVIVLCFIKLGMVITPIKAVYLILVILSGGLIQGAAFIFISVPAFWLTDSSSLGFLLWDLTAFIRYPISIYPKLIQVVLTLVIPYAFINFYPSQYFLAKNDFLIFHPFFQYISPLVAIVLFFGAYKFWELGISNYKSAGS